MQCAALVSIFVPMPSYYSEDRARGEKEGNFCRHRFAAVPDRLIPTRLFGTLFSSLFLMIFFLENLFDDFSESSTWEC